MNTDHEDAALVQRIINGDTQAFAAIVLRWQGPLVNLAYRYCRHHAKAEDMAQEAFIRAFRGLRSFRGDSAFSTWLFALANNVYRDQLRRVSPEWVAIEDNLAADALATERSAEDLAVSAERRRLVQIAVQSLPPTYREPLVLYYFHGQDVSATALTMQLPVGTVKARLSRGRALLESKLASRL